MYNEVRIGIIGAWRPRSRLPGPGSGQPEARLAFSAGSVHTLSCVERQSSHRNRSPAWEWPQSDGTANSVTCFPFSALSLRRRSWAWSLSLSGWWSVCSFEGDGGDSETWNSALLLRRNGLRHGDLASAARETPAKTAVGVASEASLPSLGWSRVPAPLYLTCPPRSARPCGCGTKEGRPHHPPLRGSLQLANQLAPDLRRTLPGRVLIVPWIARLPTRKQGTAMRLWN